MRLPPRLDSLAVPRRAALACAPILVAAALAVSACGSDDSELLAGSTAEALTSDLDRIAGLAGDSRCADASRATRELASRVDGLPNSIDPDLRKALRDGVEQLQVLTNEPDCGDSGDREETETQTETQVRTTAPPPPKAQPPPTQTQEPPAEEPPPEEPQEEDGSGGTPPPAGEVPGQDGEIPPGQEGR